MPDNGINEEAGEAAKSYHELLENGRNGGVGRNAVYLPEQPGNYTNESWEGAADS
jgi:hypothetical protein